VDETMVDLEDDYAKAGFASRLGWGSSPALLVVDVCRAYLDLESPLYAGVEDAVASCGRLVAGARAADVPVVFTRVEYAVGGADGGVFFRKVGALRCFEAGNPLGAFPTDGPAPVEGDRVVTKQYPSAFFGTDLAGELSADGIDTVVVTGLSTSGCVRASAVDAVSYGFVPLVVREACGDRDPRPHEAALFDLDAKYADVVSEAEVLEHFSTLSR
jgi:maleamate amidohydrolase